MPPLRTAANTRSPQRNSMPEGLQNALQRRRRPLPGYMSIVQTDVHPGMRSILVDWLVEVCLVRLIAQLGHPYKHNYSHPQSPNSALSMSIECWVAHHWGCALHHPLHGGLLAPLPDMVHSPLEPM